MWRLRSRSGRCGTCRTLSHERLFVCAQVLEVLLGAVSVRPGQFAAQRAANCTAVAMAALAGLVPLAKRGRSEGGAADKVAGKVLQLASCMLEDQVGGQAAVLPQQTSCVVRQGVSAAVGRCCGQHDTAGPDCFHFVCP